MGKGKRVMTKLDLMKKVAALLFKNDDIMLQGDLFALQGILYKEFIEEEKAGNVTLKRNSKGGIILPK